MLLDPFEEQLRVPTFAVEFCYGQVFKTEMVCQETVDVASGEVFVSDHPQFLGITLSGLVGGEFDNLFRYDAGVLVDRIGLDDFVLQFSFAWETKNAPFLCIRLKRRKKSTYPLSIA